MGYRASTTECIVRLLPLRYLNQEQAALCEALRREAGRCWTDMLQAHIQSRGGKWLTSVDLGNRFKGEYALHSQSIQALAQKLEANIAAARQLKKGDPAVRYPHHPKKYQTVVWKASAIHWAEDGRLHRDVNGACNICSRARYGSYSRVQARTTRYLRPLGRSRAFETGRRPLSDCCSEISPRTPAL